MSTSEPFDLRTIDQLIQLGDHLVPLTLAAVAELGIADHLAGGPKHIETLARETGTHCASLHIALAGLAGKGIFAERPANTFALTPMAEYLRTDHQYSLRDWFRVQPLDVSAWAQIGRTLRTGTPAFELMQGVSFWDYLAAHPDDSARFDGSQQAITRLELPFITLAYKWNDVRSVVDLGGGNGAFLIGLLGHCPTLHGVLFDMPHVVAAAHGLAAHAQVTDRCRVVPGSFLEGPIPSGEDVYMMKRVLWGHPDEEAARLLANVRAAMRPESRLLIIEPLRAHGAINGEEVAKRMDLKLLAMRGSGSRTREQLRIRLEGAGLRMVRIVPAVITSIVEAVIAA